MTDEQKMRSWKNSNFHKAHYTCEIDNWICTCVYDPLVARHKMTCPGYKAKKGTEK